MSGGSVASALGVNQQRSASVRSGPPRAGLSRVGVSARGLQTEQACSGACASPFAARPRTTNKPLLPSRKSQRLFRLVTSASCAVRAAPHQPLPAVFPQLFQPAPRSPGGAFCAAAVAALVFSLL